MHLLFSSRGACCLLLCLPAVVLGKRPFERRLAASQAAADAADGGPGLGPSVALLQSVMKNEGLDPVEALTMGFDSPGYKELLGNAEIHRRLLDEMPLLKAFKPFRDLANRRLQASESEVKQGFAAGMDEVFDFMKQSFSAVQDPSANVAILTKLAGSDDPHTRDVFARARGGEKGAVEELQRLFAKQQFPGLDLGVLEEVTQSHTFDKLLGMEEVMRFIDTDASLSDVFRKPFLPSATATASP